METSSRLTQDQLEPQFELEGELKLIKSFWSSSTDLYRLRYPHILIGKLRKNDRLQFKIRYDLKNYKVVLSKDNDRFNLVPLDKTLNLSKVEF